MFQQANQEPAEFYAREMPRSWIQLFGGDVAEFENYEQGRMTLQHLDQFTESSGSTFDTSGRT